MDTMKLNNGQEIPAQGFGVFMVENNGPCEDAVTKALAAGYRLLDTAAAYFNETDVGKAIKSSGISREEIFVTSKLWLQDYGYEAAKKGIDASLEKEGNCNCSKWENGGGQMPHPAGWHQNVWDAGN